MEGGYGKKQYKNLKSDQKVTQDRKTPINLRNSRKSTRNNDKRKNEFRNNFPNFTALTSQEKLLFFEALTNARKNVEKVQGRAREKFGTIHDEYLQYFAEDCPQSSRKIARVGLSKSTCSTNSINTDEIGHSNNSIDEEWDHATDEEQFLMNTTDNLSSVVSMVSISTDKNSGEHECSKSFVSSDVMLDLEIGNQCEGVFKHDLDAIVSLFMKKKKKINTIEKNDSVESFWDKKSTETFAKYEHNLSQKNSEGNTRKINKENIEPVKRSHSDVRKGTVDSVDTYSATPRFNALNPKEKEIFFNVLKEARNNVLQKNPQEEFLSVEAIFGKLVNTFLMVPLNTGNQTLELHSKPVIEGDKKVNVKIKLTCPDNERLKNNKYMEVSEEKNEKYISQKEFKKSDNNKEVENLENNSEKIKTFEPTERFAALKEVRKDVQTETDDILTKNSTNENEAMKSLLNEKNKSTETITISKKEIKKEESNQEKCDDISEQEDLLKSKVKENNQNEPLISSNKLKEESCNSLKMDPSIKETNKDNEDKRSETSESKEKNGPISKKNNKNFKSDKKAKKTKKASASKESVKNKDLSLSMKKSQSKISGKVLGKSVKKPKIKLKKSKESQKSKTSTKTKKKALKTQEKSVFTSLSLVQKSFSNGKLLLIQHNDSLSKKDNFNEKRLKDPNEKQEKKNRTATDINFEKNEMETFKTGVPGISKSDFLRHKLEDSKYSLADSCELSQENEMNVDTSKSELSSRTMVLVSSLLTGMSNLRSEIIELEHQEVASEEMQDDENIVEVREILSKNKTSVNKIKNEFSEENTVNAGTLGKVVLMDEAAINKIKHLIQDLEKKAKAESYTFDNEYVQLLLDYISYLSRVLQSLMEKEKDAIPVQSSLPPTQVYLKFQEKLKSKDNKIEESYPRDDDLLPRSISTAMLTKELPQQLEKKDPEASKKNHKNDVLPPLSVISDSESDTDSDDKNQRLLAPMFTREKRLPRTKIRLLQDLLKERAIFVEGSSGQLKIVELPGKEFDLSEKEPVRLQLEEKEMNLLEKRTKLKFIKMLTKFCRCGKKEAEADNILENLKGEAVVVDVSDGKARSPASATMNESTMEVLKAAERKKIIQKYWKTT